MTSLIIQCALSYLLGSVVGSLLLGTLRGVDIREHGSGNAGSTNALRTQGKWFAFGTALIDVGKGIAAVLVIARLAWFGPATLDPLSTGLACGLAAAIGHCYPIFHAFRGGKGAGTLFGALLVLFPWTGLGAIGIWSLTLICSGYVGLSTVIAGLAFPFLLYLIDGPVPPVTMGLAIAAGLFLSFTHRSNLQRLHAGTESRFERARLLRFSKG